MIYKIDTRRRVIQITPVREEDLYFIYLLVDRGDVVRGWTVREYKPEGADESERVKMYLAVRVEALEYHKFRGSLRIRGVVVDVQRDIEGVMGRRHTFEVVPGREIEIVKREETPLEVVVEVLNMAKAMLPRLLLVSVDDEETAIAYITAVGVEILQVITNKDRGESIFEEYVKEIHKSVSEYVRRYNPDKIVAAGPGVVLDAINIEEKIPQGSGGVAGVYEYLRRGLYEKLKIEMGVDAYEKMLQKLATDRESVAIGVGEVEEAAVAGRVAALLILDRYIKENPNQAWSLMNKVYKTKGKIYIIREELEIGRWLDKMGYVAALLRW